MVVWVVNDPTIDGSESLASSLQKIFFRRVGFNIHDTMIWGKSTFTAVGALVNRYAPVFEYMFILSKDKIKTFNPIIDRGNKNFGALAHGTIRQSNGSTKRISTHNIRTIPAKGQRFNIWEIPNIGENDFKHPAKFPENLARDHIYSWSNEGDLIYDPFMGSGTTAKMAHLMKRKWIGSEISQEYVDLANKRLKKYLDQTDLFAPEKTNGKSHGEQSDIFTRIVLDGRNGKSELKQEKVLL